MRQCSSKVVCERRVAGTVGLWLMRGVCSLSARVLHESLLVPVLTYGSETMIWREKERFRIRDVQMDNLIVFLGMRRMDKVPNARISDKGCE